MLKKVRTSLLLAAMGIVLLHPVAMGQSLQSIAAPNKVKVKFTPAEANKMAAMKGQKTARGYAQMSNQALQVLAEQFDVVEAKRLFPYSPKFEARHRAHGLDQWYELTLASSDNVKVLRAVNDFKGKAGVQHAEAYLKVKLIDGYEGKAIVSQKAASLAPLNSAVNDPQFSSQWHYDNTGQTGGVSGADISLVEAWAVETGDPDIVIAIIDGGIDVNHEDLVDNMWVNADEIPDNGIDDDNNGYVDDYYGYNFGDDTYQIPADDHGTHVAGTVAATTNNSIGVAGVAGGSGAGDGVRLMACTVFGNYSYAGFDQSFVYAADNGAVIAQNSWGYTSPGYFEQSVLDAIDYFIANAGYDESNASMGLLDGGLVIFAAGNDASNQDYYPGVYEPVVAVASTFHNDEISSFSNYGTWVDISAPGGDFNPGIYSTLPYNSYGELSGTSMACPHVSGVAGLLVSANKGSLTNTAAKQLLLAGVDDIYTANPSYTGMMGSGRLNAFTAIAVDDATAPEAIADLSSTDQGVVSISLGWTSPNDTGQDAPANSYIIKYSTSAIDDSNFDAADTFENSLIPSAVGVSEEVEITGLLPNTTYYFAIKSVDIFGNISTISNILSASTLPAPVAVVSESVIPVTLGTTETTQIVVNLANGGEGDLTFGTDYLIEPASVGQNESGTDNGFGYTWQDSRSGANYEWIYIDNSNLTGFDYSSSPIEINLPFEFPFFDSSVTSIFIQPGGYISTSEDGNGAITLFSESMVSGSFKYADFDTIFVVQFSVFLFEENIDLSYWIFLNQNGNIKIQVENIYNHNSWTDYFNSELHDVKLTDNGGLYSVIVAQNRQFIIPALAIEFTYPPRPRFITSISPSSGTLTSSDNLDITFDLTSTEAQPGNYTENVTFTTNDPVKPSFTLPFAIHISGIPELGVTENVVFDDIIFGNSDSLLVSIENLGTDTLAVSDIQLSGTVFTMNEEDRNFKLYIGQQKEFMLYATPDAVGAIAETLTITSNDPDFPSKVVNLSLQSLEPPVADITPASIDVVMNVEETASEVISIGNVQGINLEAVLDISFPEEAALSKVYTYPVNKGSITPLSKEQANSVKGEVLKTPVIAVENKATSPALHSVTDLTDILAGLEEGYEAISTLVPSTFFFYDGESGNNIEDGGNDMYDGGNYLYLDNANLYYSNKQISDFYFTAKYPGLFVASLDLNNNSSFRIEGNLGADGSGSSEVSTITLQKSGKEYIGFIKKVYNTSDPSVNHLIILENTGTLSRIYDSYTNNDYHEVTGLEGSERLHYLLFASEYGGYISDEVFLQIMETYLEVTGEGGGWLSLSQYEANVSAGTQTEILANISTEGLDPGTYSANILINTNIPSEPQITIPVSLTVNSAPAIVLEEITFDLGEVFLNETATASVTIENIGTEDLIISDIQSSDARFTPEVTSLTIAAGTSSELVVSFSSASTGAVASSLTFSTNDPTDATVEIGLQALVIDPPVMEVSPTEPLSFEMKNGETAATSFVVSNTGGETDLVYQASFRKTAAQAQASKSKRKYGFYAKNPETGTPAPLENADIKQQYAGEYLNSYSISSSYLVGVYKLGSLLYLLDNSTGSDRLLVFDTETQTVINTYELGITTSSGLTFDGELLWTVNYYGNAYGFTLEGEMVGSFSVQNSYIYGSLVYHQDRYLYKPNGSYYSILVYDESGVLRNTFDSESTQSIRSLYSPLAEERLFAKSNNYLYEVVFTETTFRIQRAVYPNYIGGNFAVESNEIYDLSGNQIYIYESGLNLNWVTYSANQSGSIAVGDQRTVEASIVPVNLPMGTHTGEMVISGNDPITPEISIPVSLTISNSEPVANQPSIFEYYLTDTYGFIEFQYYFSDADNHTLQYSYEIDNNRILEITGDNGYNLTFRMLYGGTTNITVTVDDGFGGVASTTFEVSIIDIYNTAPVAEGTPAATVLGIEEGAHQLNVASYFSDPNNDALIYSVEVLSTSETVFAEASISGSVLNVNPLAVGNVDIVVTAEDGRGGEISQTFPFQIVALDCDPTDPAYNEPLTWYQDSDSDGFGGSTTTLSCSQPADYVENSLDCDDTDASLHPNTSWYVDADSDGFGSLEGVVTACEAPLGYVANADDCDDTSATVGLATVWYADTDGDGYGDASASLSNCQQPSGYVSNAEDCDDTDASLNPETVWYSDADGDGFGSANESLVACSQPAGYVRDATDCADADASIYPGAPKLANGKDNNCDGTIDFQTQTLTFQLPNTLKYGDQPISLTATSDANIPVSFELVSGPAVVSGSLLVITGSGEITVKAYNEGSESYLPASSATTATVAQASLLISVADATVTYGEENPDFTISYQGFVNGDTQANLAALPSATTERTLESSVGNYPIVLSGASADNYSIEYVNANISVQKATAEVSISNLQQIFDGSAKSVTVTTTPTDLSVEILYNKSTSLPVNEGSYVVEARVTDANYEGVAEEVLVIEKVLGVPSASLSAWKLYPNPVSSHFYINGPHDTTGIRVMVIDAQGKEVINQLGAESIDTQQLLKGVYLVRIMDASFTLLHQERIIKQ